MTVLMWTIFKVFIELVTILFLLYILVFWSQSMWDLSPLTRDQTRTLCIGRWRLNHWTAREISQSICLYAILKSVPLYQFNFLLHHKLSGQKQWVRLLKQTLETIFLSYLTKFLALVLFPILIQLFNQYIIVPLYSWSSYLSFTLKNILYLNTDMTCPNPKDISPTLVTLTRNTVQLYLAFCSEKSEKGQKENFASLGNH